MTDTKFPFWQLLLIEDGSIIDYGTEKEAKSWQAYYTRRGVLAILGKVTH